MEPGDPLAPANRPLPTYDAAGHSFMPPPGKEIADPMVGFYRVGYAGGAEGVFFPNGRFDVDITGSEGRAYAWENGGGHGSPCGTDSVCIDGMCGACKRGDECPVPGTVCRKGMVECASGKPEWSVGDDTSTPSDR